MERSGAAQGLAEVLAVLGRSHVDALLPELLAACSSPMPFVREGNLTLFRFLPHAIPRCLPGARSAQPSSRTSLACMLSLTECTVSEHGAMHSHCVIRSHCVQ